MSTSKKQTKTKTNSKISEQNAKSGPKSQEYSKITVEPLSRDDFSMDVVKQWTRIRAKNPPKRRSNHTSFIYQNKYLYIIGGVDITEQKQSDIYRIDLTSDEPEWEKIEIAEGKELNKIAYHAGCKYKGVYYIIGGQNDKIETINTIQRLKLSDNQLLDPIELEIEKFPALESHTVNLNGNNAIVFGGNNGNDFNRDVYQINLDNFEVTNLTENQNDEEIPPVRSDHCAEIKDGKLYVYGGFGPGDVFYNDLWEFDLGGNKWTQIKFGDEEDEKAKEEAEKKKENEEKKEGEGEKKEGEGEEGEKKDENAQDGEKKEGEEREENEKKEENENKEEENKPKVDRPEGRSGQTMNKVGNVLYIFGGKLGVIKESNELWTFDPAATQYHLVHDILIEQYSEEELKPILSGEKNKKPFHWLTKREVETRTNPTPFALKNQKKKNKEKKEDNNEKKHNKSFTEQKSKYSEQVLVRPNVKMMKASLVYTSIPDDLKNGLKKLEENEKAMIDKESVLIIGSVPEPRDGQSTVTFGGNKLIIFGGDRNKFPFNDLFIFDTKTEAEEPGEDENDKEPEANEEKKEGEENKENEEKKEENNENNNA
jgi:hypothetical protein